MLLSLKERQYERAKTGHFCVGYGAMWNAILPGVDGVIILASRMTSGQPMNSLGYELIVISACVSGAFP